MTCRIARCGRRALPLFIGCLLAPTAGAQPTLWGTAAANGSFPNGRLVRIDYATGTVQATFNGPAAVAIGDGFTGVAVRPSNGQVFVTDGLGTNNVYRFDPATGAVLGSFPSPTGTSSIDGLEFVGNVLYASRVSASVIHRINPDTGAEIGTAFPGTSTPAAGGLTIVNGALYSNGSTGNTTIARRDLATGLVLGQFPTPNNEAVTALATDGTSLYAASSAGIIYRLDAGTGAVMDSRNFGIVFDGLGGPAPVPEPSGGLFLLTSALAFGAWRRSRGKSSRTSPPPTDGAGRSLATAELTAAHDRARDP
jgi:Repeat of unknown function (DUF6923)